MATVYRTPLTLEAFLALPEAEPPVDFFDGETHRKVSPKFRHARLTHVLCTHIDDFTLPRRLGLALMEFRCTFGGISVVPDVAFFRWEKIPFGLDGQPLDSFDGVTPDLFVEVVSPDQRQSVVARKLLACLDAGMPVGWLFVPDRRSVVVYSPGYPPRELTGHHALTLDQELPGWSVSVRQLYAAVWPVG